MRKYFVILTRYGTKAPWEVYKGNRGGLDPSLFLTKKAAMEEKRKLDPHWRRDRVCIVQLWEAGTQPAYLNPPL